MLAPLLPALAMCAPATSSGPEPAAPQAAQDTLAPSVTYADSGVATSGAQLEAPVEPGPELSAELQQHWQRRLAPRLKRELWKGTQRYDAAYLYMVPLHAAFGRGFATGQQELAEHVAGFLQYRDSVQLSPDAQLSWLQYFYFLSRFTAVAAAYGRADLIPPELPAALRGWTAELWLESPAWQWNRKPFPGGFRERLDWKLSDALGKKPLSYHKAILDQELLLFAIGADLRQYGRRVGSPLASDPVLQEIERYARRVYDARTVWSDSGWTFQPGVWRDHPDHLYACREQKRHGLEPCATLTGAEDASHSHRMPLVLRSMAEGHPVGSEGRAYYERLLWGLERQFFDRVAVPPSAEFTGWRLRNFMDGRNGIYRWQYKSLGPNQGYGPYELSGVLMHGWWAFLPGERADLLYRGLAGQFPLGEEQLIVYGGPGKQAQAPTGLLRNGTSELCARLAVELRSVYGRR
jgi:hypothetical protein